MNLSSEDKFSRTQDGIVLHDKNGFKAMRKAGNFAAKVLFFASSFQQDTYKLRSVGPT